MLDRYLIPDAIPLIIPTSCIIVNFPSLFWKNIENHKSVRTHSNKQSPLCQAGSFNMICKLIEMLIKETGWQQACDMP